MRITRSNRSVSIMTMDSRPKNEPENLFEKFLNINTMLLKAGGFFNECSRLKNPLGLITLAFLSAWTIGAVRQVIFYFDTNRELAIRCITASFSGSLAITKGLSLIFQSKNIIEILRDLSSMWDDRYKVLKNRTVMMDMAKRAHKMTVVYCVSCLVISLVFHLAPYKDLLTQCLGTKNENNTYNLTTIMPSIYAVDINYPANYVPVMISEHIITMFFLIYFTSSDTLFCQLLTHICLQFKLLCNDLENIMETSISASASVEEKRDCLRKMSKIVKRHNQLYSLCRRVENVFRSIFFMSMLVTSITICMSLHQLQQMARAGQVLEGLAQLCHGVVLFSEVAIYCGFSSMLSHATESVAISAYNCPWPCLGKQFGRGIQFLMLKAQRTFRCTAFGLFRLDLHQLSTIVSTAITYFTLLNTLVKLT